MTILCRRRFNVRVRAICQSCLSGFNFCIQSIVILGHGRSAGNIRQLNLRRCACLRVLYRQFNLAAGVRFVDALGAFCRVGNDAVVRAAELVSESTQVDFIVPFAVVLRDRQLVVLQGGTGHIAVQSFDIVLQAGNRDLAAKCPFQRNRITADAATGYIIFRIRDIFLVFIGNCILRFVDCRGIRIGDVRLGLVNLRVQRSVVIVYCRSAGNVRQLNLRRCACLRVLYRQFNLAAGVRFVDALGAFCRVGNDAVVRAAELVSESTQVDFIVPFAVVLRDRQLVVLQGGTGHIAVQSFDIVLQAGNRDLAAKCPFQRNRITADAATGYIIFRIRDIFLVFIGNCILRFVDCRGIRIGDVRLGLVNLRVQRSVVIVYCRSAGYVFQSNFIPSRILNDIAVIFLFCISCNQGRVGSRNHIVSTNTYIIPSRVVLTGLDVVRFAIDFKAGSCFFGSYGFHF